MSRPPISPQAAPPSSDGSARPAGDGAIDAQAHLQAEWFGLARRGDRSAFARLVQATQDRLYNAVSRMVTQPADALEVTQETYAKALESIASCRGDSQPYTWLFRIAMNCAISRRRKEHVRRAVSLDAEPRPGVEDQMSGLRARLSSSMPRPDEVVERRERADKVRAALMRLESEERALLVMRDIDDMEYAEMAKALDVPLGTLKSRLFRARQALRKELEQMIASTSGRGTARE